MWSLSKPIFKKLLNLIPKNPLTNFDIHKYVKKLGIPKFRGVFMRDKLPKKIHLIECGIVNLDNSAGDGTHWTSYIKNRENIIYFDSYGNLRPPDELIRYFNSDGIKHLISYNYENFQTFNTSNCGQLCLIFLYNNMHYLI